MCVMNLDPTLSSVCEELHFELFNSDAHITLGSEFHRNYVIVSYV